jgi:hypothetical protein
MHVHSPGKRLLGTDFRTGSATVMNHVHRDIPIGSSGSSERLFREGAGPIKDGEQCFLAQALGGHVQPEISMAPITIRDTHQLLSCVLNTGTNTTEM